MILDAYGRSFSPFEASVAPTTGSFSLRMIREWTIDADRRLAEERVRDLRESCGFPRLIGAGDIVTMRLPRRYEWTYQPSVTTA